MMQYISYRKSERLSPHTVYNQEVLLNRFLNFLSSKKVTSIKAINESHIIKYLSVIGVKYKSVASISTYILRQFFRHLYQHKLINTDLAAFIPRYNYKKQGKLPSTYSGEEIKKILSSVDRFTMERNETAVGITKELADAWCRKRDNESNSYHYKRCFILQSLSSFLCKKGIRSYIPQLPPVKNTFIPYIFSMKTNGLLEIVLAVNVMERGREWENLRTRTLVKWICMCVCLSICIPRMEITLLLVSSFAPRN